MNIGHVYKLDVSEWAMMPTATFVPEMKDLLKRYPRILVTKEFGRLLTAKRKKQILHYHSMMFYAQGDASKAVWRLKTKTVKREVLNESRA